MFANQIECILKTIRINFLTLSSAKNEMLDTDLLVCINKSPVNRIEIKVLKAVIRRIKPRLS